MFYFYKSDNVYKIDIVTIFSIYVNATEMGCYDFKNFKNKIDAQKFYNENKNLCEGDIDEIKCYLIQDKYYAIDNYFCLSNEIN